MGDVARPKRSLSSTIRCFFGNPGRDEPLLFQPVEEEPEPIAVSEPMEAEESVIVYQGDGGVRPPVLPILPVQRLRLLRQKQELRRRHILEAVHNSPLQLNLSNYSYKSSSTPSPMRAAHVALNRLPLKKKKLSRGIGKGTKWSGDLEYDLAEYDTKEKNTNFGHDVTLHEDTGSKDGTPLDVNADKLSTEQRNVLLKGPRSAAQRALPLLKPPQEKPIAKGEKIVLPSVGFDFIKGTDTPSKVKTPRPDDEDEEPRRKKRIGQASGSKEAKQHFDANGGDKTEGKTNTKQHKFTFDQNNNQLLVGQKKSENEKPAFSFGRKNDEQLEQVPRSEQDETQGKQPSFSFQQKDKTAQPKFNFGEKNNEQPKPAFVFGQKKDEQPKPAFNFGGKKDEEPKPAFNFGEKKNEEPKPAFNFGEKKDEQPKPTFNFGADKEEQSKPALKKKTNDQPNTQSQLEQDSKEPKPIFSFGSGPDENLAVASGSKTDQTVKPKLALNFGQNKDEQPKPAFNFKAKSEEPKKDAKRDAKPTFSFGAGQNESPKPSISFGSNKNDKSAKSDPSSDTNPSGPKQNAVSNGFSFSRIQQPTASEQATAPSFTFGIGSNDKSVASGPNVFAPTPKSASKPFSFSNPPSNAPWTANSTSATTGNNAPSFNFKFGAGANSQQVPAPPSNPSVNNPFVSNRNGFAFNNTNGAVGAGGGVLNAQAPAQTAPQGFGNSHSVSPAFGKSTSPSTMPNSNPSSRAFTPSNTINLNFGNVGSADPSTIFSGGGPQNAPMGTASPQQIFGGGSSQSPAQIFGQPVASQQFGAGFGAAPGVSAGMGPNPSQAPVTNFQLPPGRKLARMRQSRRG
ncbi:NUP1 (YOR098C) [Zygosaccharomyces parabailii]|nr:NUP1 (YOR098C) [Zygosaccharomyces parabailii]